MPIPCATNCTCTGNDSMVICQGSPFFFPFYFRFCVLFPTLHQSESIVQRRVNSLRFQIKGTSKDSFRNIYVYSCCQFPFTCIVTYATWPELSPIQKPLSPEHFSCKHGILLQSLVPIFSPYFSNYRVIYENLREPHMQYAGLRVFQSISEK